MCSVSGRFRTRASRTEATHSVPELVRKLQPSAITSDRARKTRGKIMRRKMRRRMTMTKTRTRASSSASSFLHAKELACDVAAVTETWLSKAVNSDYITIDGYILYRRDRGGGIALYVNDRYLSKALLTTNSDKGASVGHELMWLEITKKGQTFIVGLLYHPPKPIYDSNEFVTTLFKYVDTTLTEIVPRSAVSNCYSYSCSCYSPAATALFSATS